MSNVKTSSLGQKFNITHDQRGTRWSIVCNQSLT